MIRKTILTAAAAVAVLLGAAIPAQGQQTVGNWNLYSLFDGKNIANVVETPTKVFYVSANRLYSYDKTSNETYTYSKRNRLNDTDVSQIYYNDAKDALLIAYQTGNIDVLYVRDDRLVNMGDIADATMTTSKGINDVAFDGDKAYVATDFGLVVFSLDGHYVLESGMYNTPVSAVTVDGDKLFIADKSGTRLLYAPVSERHNSLDKFQRLGGDMTVSWLRAVPREDGAGSDYVYTGDNNSLKRLTVDWRGPWVSSVEEFSVKASQPVTANGDGTYTVVTTDSIVTVGKDGRPSAVTQLPAGLKKQKIAMRDGLSRVWAVDGAGFGCYSVSGDALTVLSEKSRPVASTVNKVAFIAGSANGEKIYLANQGTSRFKSCGDISAEGGIYIEQKTDVIVGGEPVNAAPDTMTMTMPSCQIAQRQAGSTKMFGGIERIVVDPTNPDRYYVANYLEGIIAIELDKASGEYKEVGRFNNRNMPVYVFYNNNAYPGGMAQSVLFDPEGNLWTGCWVYRSPGYVHSPWNVLPKEKLYGDMSAVTASDWGVGKQQGVDAGEKDMGAIFSSKTGMMFSWDSRDKNPLFTYDTKRTYTNTSDDSYVELTSLLDQDGKSFQPSRWICAAEDHDGRIWFGTTSGVAEISNPGAAQQADFRITRLKVPRNDGTIYADYLLETEQVNDIAVDHSNRKWIATENSGVYLVSERGDKILEHFTPENSDLPSSTVYSIYCDPNSNVVYFGLPIGLVSYNSTSAPAAEDYSDVYAYPNPVRPDYTGWITVKGLKDNSLVKIADAAGNVFYQTRSEGGMVVWDGCNASGQRVKSGVYFVFASSNENDQKSGAVTKIVVIN